MRYRRAIIAAIVSVTLTQAACTQAQPPTTPMAEPPDSVYALPIPLADADVVVAPDGDDGAAGTPEAPLRTIDAAAARATAGTTVFVRDGTYTGDVETTASGTDTGRIAYVAQSPNVRIVGSGDQDGVWENDGDYVDIVGFDVTGSNVSGLYNRGSQVRIMQNRVHDMRGNCVYAQNDDYSLTDVDVIGNVTFDCGSDELDHGIYITQQRGVVANNISYRSTGFGIQCWHACNEVLVVNNLVFDNDEGGIVIGGEIDEETGEGSTTDNSVVANNIVVDNGREGIREGGESGPGNRFVNNLLWDNERDEILLNNGREADTIVEDPRFVNFQSDGSGDYRLEPTSPAVNTGTDVMAPPVAIDGTARPQSDGVDLGPYER